MTEEILTVVISLLAIYGLSCLVMKIVVRLCSPDRGQKAFVVIPITDIAQITDRIMWGKLRFDPAFQKDQVEFAVVDCGLESPEAAVLKRYCDRESIFCCKAEELRRYIGDSICNDGRDDV